MHLAIKEQRYSYERIYSLNQCVLTGFRKLVDPTHFNDQYVYIVAGVVLYVGSIHTIKTVYVDDTLESVDCLAPVILPTPGETPAHKFIMILTVGLYLVFAVTRYLSTYFSVYVAIPASVPLSCVLMDVGPLRGVEPLQKHYYQVLTTVAYVPRCGTNHRHSHLHEKQRRIFDGISILTFHCSGSILYDDEWPISSC
jgi:hypothetical protein